MAQRPELHADALARERACGLVVHWWDGEYEGECELGAGHDGPHYDGLSWYDDERRPVGPPPTPRRDAAAA